MSGIELNKIAAAVLLASLIAMITGFVANILYKPKLSLAQRGYQVEAVEVSAAAAVPEAAIDIKALMAKANAEAGAVIIKRCISCHDFQKDGPNKVGPNLWKIAGGPKKHKSDFAYSKAFENVSGTWDDESLFHFLHKPSKFIPGTKMAFAGLNKYGEIADVIAFLKEKAS